MRIGMLDWSCFGKEDMAEAFAQLGHKVTFCSFSDSEEAGEEHAAPVEKRIRDAGAELLFSFNYFPSASIACRNLGIPYVAWVYDSPYVRMYHYTIANPVNYVFVFDKSVYLEFQKGGISTVHYLPMAANTARLAALENTDAAARIASRIADEMQHRVAFVGSLYTEKHQFFKRLTHISDYTRGYLNGLMQAQKLVYGCNFVQELLTETVMADMRKDLPMQVQSGGVEKEAYLFAQYVINRELTAIERQELLESAAASFGLDLYSPDRTFAPKNCSNHGTVDAYRVAPCVYHHAAINLNISLRSIVSGIPLRAFEVMGAGGFLLTNFQADFLDFFVPGEDFVYFESKADMLNKLAYYLQHDEERWQIAQSGRHKVEMEHTYVHRASEILSYIRK